MMKNKIANYLAVLGVVGLIGATVVGCGQTSSVSTNQSNMSNSMNMGNDMNMNNSMGNSMSNSMSNGTGQ